ncbi:hypothetical protein [Pseudorhodobacter sp. E13]|nr:hypothetical protein [Pseudorhodobacter sp. E13]
MQRDPETLAQQALAALEQAYAYFDAEDAAPEETVEYFEYVEAA